MNISLSAIAIAIVAIAIAFVFFILGIVLTIVWSVFDDRSH